MKLCNLHALCHPHADGSNLVKLTISFKFTCHSPLELPCHLEVLDEQGFMIDSFPKFSPKYDGLFWTSVRITLLHEIKFTEN